MSESHQLSLPAGFVLDRYRLWEVLGSGSFGITYLARDVEEGQFVAIKELLPGFMVTRQGTQVMANSPDDQAQWEWAQQRFREEAEALLRCNHPNVLKVYCTFPANGTVYMVTRYEEGQVMEKWLRKLQKEEQRWPTEEELVRILGSVLQALEHIHAQGFLHRDIKPENIYLTNDQRVVLLDFGSARQVVVTKTMPVTTILTPGYAPPEQYASAARQGPWTDLYAVGGAIYRAITGEVPPDAVSRNIPGMSDPCKRLAKAYAGKFSASLLQSIDRALETDYRKRFQSAGEWRSKLPAPVKVKLDTDRSEIEPKLGGWNLRGLSTRPDLFIGAGVTALAAMAISLCFAGAVIVRRLSEPGAETHKMAENPSLPRPQRTPSGGPIETPDPDASNVIGVAVAGENQKEERRRIEEEKKKIEEERQKVEADRKKQAEEKRLADAKANWLDYLGAAEDEKKKVAEETAQKEEYQRKEREKIIAEEDRKMREMRLRYRAILEEGRPSPNPKETPKPDVPTSDPPMTPSANDTISNGKPRKLGNGGKPKWRPTPTPSPTPTKGFLGPLLHPFGP